MLIAGTEAAPGGTAGATSARRKPNFRPEVQGLRALAVLMVVTYHVWLGRVSGGVDIFLLISAFLLTLSFVRKVEAGTSLNLLRHWLHLFKRLLPAAVVVILGVLAGTWLILPQSRWPAVLDQAWASLLYRQNWLLADTAVDYYAQDHAGASPLQHFWSLSIQGQVFILWPLVFACAAVVWKLLRRRYNISYRAVLAGRVSPSSLQSRSSSSIDQTATNQAYAYFDTRTRLWEFALGSLLALGLPLLNPGKVLRAGARLGRPGGHDLLRAGADRGPGLPGIRGSVAHPRRGSDHCGRPKRQPVWRGPLPELEAAGFAGR